MSGSTLAMAPAVESTPSLSFHRSHSTPDLLLLDPSFPNKTSFSPFHRHRPVSTATTTSLPSKTAAAASASALDLTPTSTSSPPSVSTGKSLPSLPAFNVPVFDLDLDADLELSPRQKKKTPPQADPQAELQHRIWADFLRKKTAEAEIGAGAGAEPGSIAGARSGTAGVGSDVKRADDNKPGARISTSSNLTKAQSPSAVSSARQEKAPKAELAVEIERPSRRRTLIDRPRSWMHTSRSTPNIRELFVQEKEKEARHAAAAVVVAAIEAEKYGGSVDTTTFSSVETAEPACDNMADRPRASFVDFAKRSWISRSPSPRPPTPKTRKTLLKKDDNRDESGLFGGKLSRKRAGSTARAADSRSRSSSTASIITRSRRGRSATTSGVCSVGSVGGVDSGNSTIRPTPTSGTAGNSGAAAISTTATATTLPAPRPFSRASEYLTRIKQRPQNRLLRSGSSTNITSIDGEGDKDDGGDSDGATLTGTPTASAPTTPLDPQPCEAAAGLVGRRISLQTADSSRTSSSDARSATGSAALPASEAESLTTADTSNQNTPMTHPTSGDPLWVPFKDLEAGFFKYLSKSTTPQRMNLVRTSLVPFLCRYARDSSSSNTKLLSPEDVERRTSIFGRWWTALLELLDNPNHWQGGGQSQAGSQFNQFNQFNQFKTSSGGAGTYFPTSATSGSHFQPITGVDRPLVLEAVSMIMSRPEWRLLTTSFRPFSDRSPGERVRARANTSDTAPLEDSGFLVEESAEHNIRNTFVNNLMAQLVLVVEKMSLRNAPLSMVSFSGKACAYAFFFVPGVADILVRLWGLEKSIDLVRRAADAFGLPRRSRGESSDMIALFPPCVGPLGWSSVNSMHAKLRRPPKMNLMLSTSVACTRMNWFAPCWLSRWRGASSDLLFIFCKYYHVLAGEFMPSTLVLPLVEKARAPGFVLLHAQLLHILDNTIHREAAMEAAMMMAGSPMADGGATQWQEEQQSAGSPVSASASASTFASASADASLLPFMWQPSHNLFRDMDEQRLIALLRDFLASGAPLADARDTFARSLMVLLKAAACRTSQYDHSACYMLCDFLQEILLAFDSYYDYCNGGNINLESPPVDYIDWNFWLDVCKMMMSSNNTMSEIRVLSFVFSTWNIVTADPGRKEELSIRWLLSEDVFNKFFNNWCPMVRAYYMRLLCWRMCRDSGSPNELDAKIFLLVSQRLKTVWSHYLWLKQKAEKEGTLQPSTAPSLPQPGKRFMIVRTEVSVPQPGLLVNASSDSGMGGMPSGFDTLASALVDGSGSAADYRRGMNGPGSKALHFSTADDKKTDGSSAKKKWSLLGKVLSFSASTSPPSGKQTSEEQLEQMRRDTAAARSSSPVPSRAKRLGSPSSDSDSSTGSSPVFDASRYVFKFMLHNIPWQGLNGGSLGGPGEIVLPPVYRDRILTRPRLPTFAQARVSARLSALGKRSDSPPPPPPGLPPVTRRVSGAATSGLISEARNANPEESVPDDDETDGGIRLSVDARTSGSLDLSSESRRSSLGCATDNPPVINSFEWERRGHGSRPVSRNGPPDDEFERARQRELIIVKPAEPKGPGALLRTKYAGRALAEWGLVVNECNSFVDRRRDEGIYGLKDVEVPTLGIEGLRHVG